MHKVKVLTNLRLPFFVVIFKCLWKTLTKKLGTRGKFNRQSPLLLNGSLIIGPSVTFGPRINVLGRLLSDRICILRQGLPLQAPSNCRKMSLF